MSDFSKEKRKELDSILNKINTSFKNKVVNLMSDVEEDMKVKYIKTPSFEFNNMLGEGIGVGKIIEFFGRESSGKTMMALEIISKKMKEDKDAFCAWLETEGSLNPSDLEMFGIDQSRLVIIKQSEELPCEQCMDVLRGLITSGSFCIVVLNSIAGLLPSKEVSDSFDKQNIALKCGRVV